MTMTDAQRSDLALIVPDPDAWLAHAVATFGEETAARFLAEKLARHGARVAALKAAGAPTRAERDAAEA